MWPMAKKRTDKLSDKIRQAILDSEFSRYRIAAEIGCSQALLSKFVNHKGSLSMRTLDRLADLLGLDLAVRGKGGMRKER